MLQRRNIIKKVYQLYLSAKHHSERTIALLSLLVVVSFFVVDGLTDDALIPETVDAMRNIVGPKPVAQIETLTFQAEDTARQVRYQVTGSESSIQWATANEQVATVHRSASAPMSTAAAATQTPAAVIMPAVVPTAVVPSAVVPTAGTTPASVAAPISATSNSLAWSPYVTTDKGQSVLERTLVSPDPTRPYAQAAIVRIDMQQTQLHLVAGTQEPFSTVRVARTGRIPAPDYPNLLAAFNGGFKAINGEFGMDVNGTVLLPPHNGLATLALYRDGRVRIGVWGTDMRYSADMVSFRQNCPLLVDKGIVTALVSTDNAVLWGRTVGNKVATWRSGLGLSADGRYLIYVSGNNLTVPSLAQALIMGGASRAMQLDINSFWTRFVTYTNAPNGTPVAQKLLSSMAGNQQQFVVSDSRDFFYVTLR